MNDNKLIAEFVGEQPKSILDQGKIYKDYSKSWDWLMPVVNKCLNIYHIEQKNDDINFKFYDSMGDIKETYKAVVEFIKEYNRDE